ncbi:MAG TPA: hypothetical protein PKA37_11345 [Planctomycetota bacterium]|nr:hypothetical protein [Planctomycetota bacterium]
MYSIETDGIEWDWFAFDEDRHVALFSSGGSGQVPRGLLAHEAAIQALLDYFGIRCDAESWRVAADCGLFGYDVDVRGGPFRRLTVPKRALILDDVPEPHRELIARASVRGRFSTLRKLDCTLVSCKD